jgi:hypothetical protein
MNNDKIKYPLFLGVLVGGNWVSSIVRRAKDMNDFKNIIFKKVKENKELSGVWQFVEINDDGFRIGTEYISYINPFQAESLGEVHRMYID